MDTVLTFVHIMRHKKSTAHVASDPEAASCRHRTHHRPRHGRGRPRQGRYCRPRGRIVDRAPPSTRPLAGHAVDARCAREARGCAWSGGGRFGGRGAVEDGDRKPAATQTVREKRPALVRGRREHGKGTPAGVGRRQAEAGFGQTLAGGCAHAVGSGATSQGTRSYVPRRRAHGGRSRARSSR